MNRLNRARGLLSIAALALCVLAPWVARAETDAEKKQRAKERYEIATRFYDVGKYGEAVKEYEEAYMLTGDPALLFNIGQAYRLWDHSEDAIRVYKNYLRQRPDAVNRADVEKKIADLDKVVEERRRSGGAPLAEPAAPPPAPGEQPPLPGAAPVSAEPAPMPQAGLPPAGVVVATPPGSSTPPKSDRAWLNYSLLGVGGACLVTAAVAGMLGASKAKKLQDAAQNRQPFDPAVEQNGKTANLVAVTTGVVGLVAGGVGGYFFWRDRKAARASVAVVPVISATFAGGSALLTF